MKTAIITSMDEAYFDKCGQSMLLSYLKYQKSEDIPLYLYNEGDFDVPKGIKKLGFELGSEFDNFNNYQDLSTSRLEAAKEDLIMFFAQGTDQ